MGDTVNLSNLVSVYGSGVSAPLLQTNDARLIQLRGPSGKLIAMLFKLTDTLWGFVTESDPDWADHKKRLEIDDASV